MARRKKRNKGTAALRKVIREAKKIVKKHPTWSWKHALKEAGKKVRKKRRK